MVVPSWGSMGSVVDAERSWANIVQGNRRFRWETFRASPADIASCVGGKFFHVVPFSDEEVEEACARWQNALFGKFLERGFSSNFVQREFKASWNIQGDLKVSVWVNG